MAKRLANWSSEEEVVLVEEIGKREGILFGKMKGDGCIKIGEIRNRGWQEVADVLNAQILWAFLTSKYINITYMICT